MDFIFLECCDKSCRLRFPVEPAEAAASRCPRCRGPLRPAAVSGKGHFVPQPAETGLPLAGLLDNIRSIHNVGSMFRTADGVGMTHLHLSGITATPDHPRLAKAALGAHETVPWTYRANGVDAAAALIATGYQLWALERTGGDQASLFDRVAPDAPLAVIVGNEKAGVDPGILAQCDAVVSLPMSGRKSSLNAAVAFGIALYHLRYGSKREAAAQAKRSA